MDNLHYSHMITHLLDYTHLNMDSLMIHVHHIINNFMIPELIMLTMMIFIYCLHLSFIIHL